MTSASSSSRYDAESRSIGDAAGAVAELRALAGIALELEGGRATLGGVEVRPGDWVMRDEDGRLYVVRAAYLWLGHRSQPVE